MVEADKGGHWEKKKVQQSDSVAWMLGAWVEGEDWLKKKATKQEKETVTQKEKASTCTGIKGELNRDTKSLFNLILRENHFK